MGYVRTSTRPLQNKGFETRDWKMVRDHLEVLWLPEHPEDRYEVEK